MTQAERRTPRTGRGEQTRGDVLAAAQEVFWRKGYVDTRVSDIVKEAGVSHGTFYTYFDSKEAVLWAIAADLGEATVRTGTGTRAEAGGDEVGAIELANRRYLQFYLDNRKAMRLMEEVATFNPEMRDARALTRSRFVERIERSLQRLQQSGACDRSLDVTVATYALVSMVTHFAYVMVSTEMSVDLDVAVETLTKIWARGIGLDVPSAEP